MKKNNNATEKLTKRDMLDADLRGLNTTFHNFEKATADLAAEYRKFMNGDKKSGKDFEAIKEKIDELSRLFNEKRREIPRTKFDMAKGAYFFAEEDGKEVFAIRVRRTDTFDVRVTAGSSGEAMDRAKMQVARENGIPLNCLEAEDYSR